jgi:glycolate oxidase FAD binding subunit
MMHPATLAELCDAVRSAPRVIAVGAGTKPRLSAVAAARIATTSLRGITGYDPGEFTFTALAGTPLADVVATLAAKGQYLPFDPLLVEAGGTLGGAVAANTSGPGRFRCGGIRDFILGVRFVDGLGRLLRLGGDVVKNAAGFDVPKFLVGSLGRFAVIGELTFKVFPRPAATRTLAVPQAAGRLAALARSRYEIDALDVPPGGDTLLVRLAGPPRAVDAMAREIARDHGGAATDDGVWREIRETPWAFRSDITPAEIPACPRAHVSCGGSLALWREPPSRGLALTGSGPLWVGGRPRYAIEDAVKRAFDPVDRFPSLDE